MEIDSKDNKGWTALHHACANDQFESASLLISCGFNTDILDKKGRPAVFYINSPIVRQKFNRALVEFRSQGSLTGLTIINQDIKESVALHNSNGFAVLHPDIKYKSDCLKGKDVS